MFEFQNLMNQVPLISFQSNYGAMGAGEQSRFIGVCRKAIQALIADIESKIFGQQDLIRRLIEAMILQSHVLVEGLPGEGKTRSVRWLAEFSQCRYRWVQGRPDLVSSDLSGKQVLRFLPDGQPSLEFVPGPVYTQVLIMDEVNRSPGKAKAVILQVMQDKVVDRLDTGREELVIHPELIEEWRKIRNLGITTCYGLPLPDPNNLTKRDVCQTVVATQNPIEMEGTYPLPEAQLDRFMFLVKVIHPKMEDYNRIVRQNLAIETGVPSTPVKSVLPPCPVPVWQRMNSMFELIRSVIFATTAGSLYQKLSESAACQDLYERVKLVVYLTRWKHGQRSLYASDEVPTKSDPTLQRVEAVVRNAAADLRPTLEFLLTDPRFEFVEWGSSLRGLIDWVAAALVDCFLDGDDTPQRKHFRATAAHVLAHRVTLSPQAAAEGVTSEDIVRLLVDALLPDLAAGGRGGS